MRSDPGIGTWDAPDDSPEYAKRFRLAWLATKHDLRTAPERFANYLRKALEKRMWTRLNGPDGNTFRTFDEFCIAPEPWGFGEPWGKIKPFLVGVMTEEELDVATAPPDGRKWGADGRARGEHGHFVPSTSNHDDKMPST